MKIILLTLFLFVSCTKKEEVWSQLDVWKMANDFDSTIELVPIPDTDEGRLKRILCSNYRNEGCMSGTGKRIKVRLVEVLVIQYDSTRNACLAALEIGQWHGRNWLFDDVTNEPVLMDFVKKVFKAQRPRKKEDCES